jgi:hypothetical protein
MSRPPRCRAPRDGSGAQVLALGYAFRSPLIPSHSPVPASVSGRPAWPCYLPGSVGNRRPCRRPQRRERPSQEGQAEQSGEQHPRSSAGRVSRPTIGSNRDGSRPRVLLCGVRQPEIEFLAPIREITSAEGDRTSRCRREKTYRLGKTVETPSCGWGWRVISQPYRREARTQKKYL